MLSRCTAGFTLVETLVALALLLAGLAGSSLLLVRTLQYERESAHRRTALRAATSLAEELRAAAASGAGWPVAGDPRVLAWSAATVPALPAGAAAGISASAAPPATVRIVIDWPAAGGGIQHLELPVRP